MRHAGKLVLITGSTRGIGLATAKRFASEGAHVVLHGRRDSEAAEKAIEAVKSVGEKVDFVPMDLASAEAGGLLIDKVCETIGTIDVAIWNSSLNMRKPFMEYSPEDFDAISAMNQLLQKVPDSEVSKDNLLRLQNRKKMNMKAFGMPWFSLGLERPPASMGELRTGRKGFRQPKQRRG